MPHGNIFAYHNVISDVPFTRYFICICLQPEILKEFKDLLLIEVNGMNNRLNELVYCHVDGNDYIYMKIPCRLKIYWFQINNNINKSAMLIFSC